MGGEREPYTFGESGPGFEPTTIVSVEKQNRIIRLKTTLGAAALGGELAPLTSNRTAQA
jgi:hypothetical protein